MLPDRDWTPPDDSEALPDADEMEREFAAEEVDYSEPEEPHVYHWTDEWPEGTPLNDIFVDNN